MEISNYDVKIREALSTVSQYFSDSIPPALAAESFVALLDKPAQLMTSEIIRWISDQYQANKKSVPVTDYLYHAVCKLQYLAHLQLVSKQSLEPYLNSVKQLLLNYCPPEQRHSLKNIFDQIEMSETAKAVPINYIYRQKKPNESESEILEEAISQQTRDRRLSILWSRLKSEVQQPTASSVTETRKELVPQLIATAASNAQSSEEFLKFQEHLKSLGMASGTDQIFRALSNSLPEWMITTTGTDAAKSHNPAMEAMRQIIHLSGDYGEGCKRFQDMVQAAIEQFNSGSLARTATMLDLALGIASEGKLDPAIVVNVRKTFHKSLDPNRLRDLVKERDKHPLLRKILNFFDEFSVESILANLKKEDKRDRRRLLLGLLDVYGDAARKTAFEWLKELLVVTDVATNWHFARNLVCVLNGSSRSSDIPLDMEIELAAQLLNLSLPAPLVKEAIKYAGQIKCIKSEELLIAIAEELEKIVNKCANSGKNAVQELSLLDRAIFALAHYGTPKACGTVVSHGISCHEEWGDTAARLTYLSSQDLTEDQENLARLIRFLKSNTPRKLLGMTIHKNDALILHTIKALSSTPAPIVRATFKEIVVQFHDTKFGQAAASALKEFEAMEKSGTQADLMMNGALDLFGLPDLLQHFGRLQTTGTLTLKDIKGNTSGTFSWLAGRIHDCIKGHLKGIEAAYQLLEKPAAGTFIFQGLKNSEIQERPDKQKFPDLDSVLSEGMRRYDGLQRARAMVPDFSILKRKGPEPKPSDDPINSELFNRIWNKTAKGTSPEECEAICFTDSYPIRTLLACWVEEGVLTVE